ncbi:hypothetical protein [Microbacterium sp.]
MSIPADMVYYGDIGQNRTSLLKRFIEPVEMIGDNQPSFLKVSM